MTDDDNIKEAEVKEVTPDVAEKEPEISKEKETQKMRQILIETDGNSINMIKAEVSGSIELIAIFRNLIEFVGRQK